MLQEFMQHEIDSEKSPNCDVGNENELWKIFEVNVKLPNLANNLTLRRFLYWLNHLYRNQKHDEFFTEINLAIW
jgi:hypothetical protein